MRTTAIHVAGAMLSLAAFGAAIDSSTEERYRAKYGRYTPVEEAREKTAAKREAPACCRDMNTSFKNGAPSQAFAEALFRAKYGRNTCAAEPRETVAAEATAKHVRSCVQLGNCTLMQPDARPVRSSPPAPADAWRETLRAKYGRTIPANTEREFLLSAAEINCEHECCKRAD